MRAKRQPIYQGDGTALIPLTRGLFVIVDAEDAEWLCQRNWQAHVVGRPASRRVYAIHNITKEKKHSYVFMHHEILGVRDVVDHKNRNSLDNRRANLRPATFTQNAANTSLRCDNTTGYKGVSLSSTAASRDKPWVYELAYRVDGARRRIRGYAATAEDAALKYNNLAVEHFGPFATLNDTAVAEDVS